VDATNRETLTASTGLARYNSPRAVLDKVSVAARSPWRGIRGLRVEGRGSRVDGWTEDFWGRLSSGSVLSWCEWGRDLHSA
jgi:hypothetical protein